MKTMLSVDLLDPSLFLVVQMPLFVESKWVRTGAFMPAGGHQGVTNGPDRIVAEAGSRRRGRRKSTGNVSRDIIYDGCKISGYGGKGGVRPSLALRF